MSDQKPKTTAETREDERDQAREPLKAAIAKAASSRQALAVIAQECQDLAADLRPLAPTHAKKLQELSDLAIQAFDPSGKVDPRKPSEERAQRRPAGSVVTFRPIVDRGRPLAPQGQQVSRMAPVVDPKGKSV